MSYITAILVVLHFTFSNVSKKVILLFKIANNLFQRNISKNTNKLISIY